MKSSDEINPEPDAAISTHAAIGFVMAELLSLIFPRG